MADLDNDPGSMNPNRSGTGKTWDTEDNWWRSNFEKRPYAQSGLGYDYYRPAYQYGHESASHYMGRKWDDVESDLRSGWDKYEHRSEKKSTWEDVKDAVRDAWHRVTGESDLDADRMSESRGSRSTRP